MISICKARIVDNICEVTNQDIVVYQSVHFKLFPLGVLYKDRLPRNKNALVTMLGNFFLIQSI